MEQHQQEEVYESVNDELIDLIDNFTDGHAASGHAGSRAGSTDDYSLISAREDFGWLQCLAGALRLPSVEALFDENSLAAVRRDEQQQRRRQHRPKTVLQKKPAEKQVKQEERRTDEVRQQRQQFGRLVSIGNSLIDRFIPFHAATLDTAIVLDEKLVKDIVKRERVESVVNALCLTRECATASSLERTRSATEAIFAVTTIFRLFLDNSAQNQNAEELIDYEGAVADEVEEIFTLRATTARVPPKIVKAEERKTSETTSTSPRKVKRERGVTKENVIDWRALRGTKSVNLPLLEELYSSDGMESIVMTGCSEVYATHPNSSPLTTYPAIMQSYLFGKNKRAREDALMKLNVFDEGEDGQPHDVNALLHRVMGDAFNDRIAPELLKSHFAWCYFTRSAPDKMGADWLASVHQPLDRDTLHYDELLDVEREWKPALAEYLSMVILLLFGKPTPLLVTDAQGKPLFRPASTQLLALASTPVEMGEWQRFDQLNDAMPQLQSLIDNNTLLMTLRENTVAEEDLVRNDTLGVPLLNLLQLLSVYFAYMQRSEAKRPILLVLDTTEATEATEATEEDEMDVIITPSPQSAASLKPVYQFHVNVAFDKVQLGCPGLRGMPLRAFTEQSALDTGLSLAFAQLVELSLAASRGTSAVRYRARHQKRDLVQERIAVMTRLRAYRYKQLKFGTYVIGLAGEEARVKRRKLERSFVGNVTFF
jgi:hypothetical protein